MMESTAERMICGVSAVKRVLSIEHSSERRNKGAAGQRKRQMTANLRCLMERPPFYKM